MKKIVLLLCIMLIGIVCAGFVFASEAAEARDSEKVSEGDSLKFVAAAIAVGLSCIAGGIAVGRIGSSAMGAMSENPELFGKALPFVGLAEGICLWGFLVALLILFL